MTQIEKSKADKAFNIFEQIKLHKSSVVNSILEIGGLLCTMEEEKLYEFLDFGTFEEFIASPEISFSRTSAYNYMRLHRIYVQQLDIKRERLVEITQGKLLIASSVVDRNPDEWLTKAKELSRSDLKSEVAEVLETSIIMNVSLQKMPPSLPDLASYKSYTDFVKAHPCIICGKKAVGHHFPRTKGAGAEEWKQIPLCLACHAEVHINAKEWLWVYRVKIFDYFYNLLYVFAQGFVGRHTKKEILKEK